MTLSVPRRRELMGEINIIPLVDVVLVLLIIFMITAPLLVRGIDLTLPKTETNTIQPEKRFILNVTANGIVYLNEEEIPFKRLRERLIPLSGKPVYLRADSGVPYGEVMRVIDLMKQVRIDQIGLLTDIPQAKRPR